MGKNTIIATSCMDARSYSEQPVWRHIAGEKPNLLLLLGDQIYMDSLKGDALYKRDWQQAHLPAEKQVFVDKFARDMHDRYADQWAVSSFRECVVSIRKAGGRVLITWDDHDFAWNNSCGAGNESTKGVVPKVFKDVAYKLFAQFVTQVQSAESDAPYPAQHLAASPTLGLASMFAKDVLPASAAAVSLALLDGRTEREPHANGSVMIGPTQLANLQAYVMENSGLLIVASGSPMKRGGAFADVSWWQEGARNVKELKPFLDKAAATQKPIIYIGGDIHSNKLLGFSFTGVPIYDVLASGAAKKRGEGNYVRITVNSPTVTLDSRVLTANGAKVESSVTKILDLKNWMSNVQSVAGSVPEAADSANETHAPDVDSTDLNHAAQRAAFARYENTESLAIKSEMSSFALAVFRGLGSGNVSSTNELARLGEAFVDELPTGIPTPPDQKTLYSATYDETPLGKAFTVGDTPNDRVKALEWAMQADATDTPPLVIYVHGFNNSFYDSIARARKLEQLYNLRSVGANSVPGIFTFSWPAGKNRWVFDAPSEFKQAMTRLPDAAIAFTQLLADITTARVALTEANTQQRELVLLARSTGAWLLENAVLKNNAAGVLKALFKCVVLSQPLTNTKTHKKWINMIDLPTYVTINVKDRILLSADDLGAVVEPLGCNIPEMAECANKTVYFDTTGGTMVGSDHDVILRDQSEARYTDPSLYGFHQFALHGQDPTIALKQAGVFQPDARYAKHGYQLWIAPPMDGVLGGP